MKLKPSSQPFHYSLGDRGEVLACDYLTKNGYTILAKNYRCKIGEIDIVAGKDKRIIFVEVKTRASHDFGRPEEAVHHTKQKKIIRVAQWYLKEHPAVQGPIRFDVIAVTADATSFLPPAIKHIPQAFNVPDDDTP